MPVDLASYIKEFGLDDQREFLLRIARPSIEIISTAVPIAKGSSKFGGHPDVPTDFKWPHHKLGDCLRRPIGGLGG